MNIFFRKIISRSVAIALICGVGISCTDGIEEMEQVAIRFSVTAEDSTRGSMLGSENFEEFSLYAYRETGDLYFANNIFTKVGWSWSMETIFYWPKDEKTTTFYGYAPLATSDNGLSVDSTNATISYTMPTDIENQPDLMFASDTQYVSEVILNFKHILSQIKFSVKGGDGSHYVSKISISNIYTEGVFSMQSEEWSLSKTLSDSVFEAKIVSNETNADGDKTLITTTDGYIFVIPQTASNLKIHIDIVNANDATDIYEIEKDLDVTWSIGESYNYVIDLTDFSAL